MVSLSEFDLLEAKLMSEVELAQERFFGVDDTAMTVSRLSSGSRRSATNGDSKLHRRSRSSNSLSRTSSTASSMIINADAQDKGTTDDGTIDGKADNPQQIRNSDSMTSMCSTGTPSEAVLQSEDAIKDRVDEIDRLVHEQGGSTGGWQQEDHDQFTLIRARIRSKAEFVQVASREIPRKTIYDVVDHNKWYIQHEKLLREKRALVTHWREMRKAQREAGRVQAKQQVEHQMQHDESRSRGAQEKAERRRKEVEQWRKERERAEELQRQRALEQQAKAEAAARLQRKQELVRFVVVCHYIVWCGLGLGIGFIFVFVLSHLFELCRFLLVYFLLTVFATCVSVVSWVLFSNLSGPKSKIIESRRRHRSVSSKNSGNKKKKSCRKNSNSNFARNVDL
jgi:hypothetical protein